MDKADPPLTYRNLNVLFFDYKYTKDAENKEQLTSFRVYIEGNTIVGSMCPNDVKEQNYNPRDFWENPTEYSGGLVGELQNKQITKERLYKLGELLTALALPGKVRELFDKLYSYVKQNGQGLRLRLRIDAPELARLPWEYMVLLNRAPAEHKPPDILVLDDRISIVRTHTVYEPLPAFIPLSPMRFLGVLSNSPDPDHSVLNIEDDEKIIEEEVEKLRMLAGEELLDKVYWVRPPTVKTLETALNDDGADIFYYAGHARFDIQQSGQLILEKEGGGRKDYPIELLTPLLKKARVRLVVLNACETAHRDGQSLWDGIAYFLREHIPIIIGNQFDIEDKSARLLAKKFYTHLLIGYTVDEALCKARKAIFKEYEEDVEQCDWGVPVLYLRSHINAVLFPIQKKKIKQDFYSRAEDCAKELQNMLTKLQEACKPFTSKAVISSEESDTVNECIDQLHKYVEDFSDLLTEITSISLAELNADPLDQYMLMVGLDQVNHLGDNLEAHIADFPTVGQGTATSDMHKQIREDMNVLRQQINKIQTGYAYMKPPEVALTTSLSHTDD